MKKLELASPAEMSPCARAREITTILSAALIRTHAAHSPEKREIPLGFLPRRSVHTTPYQAETL